jgi:hypothetical protein
MGSIRRLPFDLESYSRRSQTGPCFICGIVNRDPSQPEEIVYLEVGGGGVEEQQVDFEVEQVRYTGESHR